ncbi:hypothetical protein [Nocardia arthritidis]|uniref:Uncharacterized protein n=1 Tax=Nocardia arthritidis TaxID=228602 RepID=A0A6G9YV93_9NOCA|nr:hypothetical protein [Nocardia arthritidis]QIS16753.1 hypothetical protein F5544_44750 [Nocardia arthritidis]
MDWTREALARIGRADGREPALALARVIAAAAGKPNRLVGDRPSHDGAAVDIGMPTLLVPVLTEAGQCRLHLATAAAGIRTSATKS